MSEPFEFGGFELADGSGDHVDMCDRHVALGKSGAERRQCLDGRRSLEGLQSLTERDPRRVGQHMFGENRRRCHRQSGETRGHGDLAGLGPSDEVGEVV